MNRKFLCAVIILSLWAGTGYSFTWWKTNQNITSVKNNDDDYVSFTSKYPEHIGLIDRLYGKYSGWIIPLAENFGIAPLAAADGAEETDYILPILYRYAQTFTELYNSLTCPENVRAETALKLLMSLCVYYGDTREKYTEAVKAAVLKDSTTYLTGRNANRYARQIAETLLVPANFLDDLRNDSNELYKKLLNELGRADYNTLRECIQYPNASAFMLNTGRQGIRLIDETNGQIIVLSWLLSDEEQKRLPDTFRKYPGLSEALNYCGAESYFKIMICPELYFQMTAMLNGTREERHIMAYAVLLNQIDAGETEFLRGLSRADCKRLAGYAAELMNLPDDNENFFGSSAAPINENLFFEFTSRYGNAAVDLCMNFGAVIDVSNLFMRNWNGGERDISPVLEAVRQYKDRGLQAAIFFRDMTDSQKFILSYKDMIKRSDLLMLMFYDEIFMHRFANNIADMNNEAEYLLEHYYPAPDTGMPLELDDDNSAVSYVISKIPGYDVISPVYNFIKYGQTPTLSQYLLGFYDLIELIPMAGTIASGIAEKGWNDFLVSSAKNAVNNVSSLTLEDLKSQAKELFKSTEKRSVIAVAEHFEEKEIQQRLSRGNAELERMYIKPKNTRSSRDYAKSNEEFISDRDKALSRTINNNGIDAVLNHLAAR